MKKAFMDIVQERVAEVAIGASTLRNIGASGVVEAAREFLKQLDLEKFVVKHEAVFRKRLDEETQALQKRFPSEAKHWGAARKAINIFLRDALYNRYLCQHFKLQQIDRFLEIPLDGYTAKGLKDKVEEHTKKHSLRWPGLKGLNKSLNNRYQDIAEAIAKEHRTSRVHYDMILWLEGRQKRRMKKII